MQVIPVARASSTPRTPPPLSPSAHAHPRPRPPPPVVRRAYLLSAVSKLPSPATTRPKRPGTPETGARLVQAAIRPRRPPLRPEPRDYRSRASRPTSTTPRTARTRAVRAGSAAAPDAPPANLAQDLRPRRHVCGSRSLYSMRSRTILTPHHAAAARPRRCAQNLRQARSLIRSRP